MIFYFQKPSVYWWLLFYTPAALYYICDMESGFFSYDKKRVIHALRYHFISRREIRILIIAVNVFAVLSATLFFFRIVSPLAFLLSSFLWLFLMITFWFILPRIIYNKTVLFRQSFRVNLSEEGLAIKNERGGNSWSWSSFSSFLETPHFFHFYLSGKSFFIIPKEAFPGDMVHEARKLCLGKIKSGYK